MKTHLLTVLLLLSACTTTQDLQGQKPALDVQSAKTQTQIVECLGSRWVPSFRPPITTTPIEGGTAFSLQGAGLSYLYVTIIDSHVRVYARFNTDPHLAQLSQCL